MPMRLRTEIPDLSGITEWVNDEVEKEQLLGKPILVHFWSVSCHMCKESLPQVNQIREENPELQLVGIHMPRSEKDLAIEPVKETIAKYELVHPQGIDNTHTIVDRFENQFVPAFYLFDRKGQLRHRSAGEKALNLLKNPLERVLKENE
jgi:thiol-disulfide isomerase/thioredoxin